MKINKWSNSKLIKELAFDKGFNLQTKEAKKFRVEIRAEAKKRGILIN